MLKNGKAKHWAYPECSCCSSKRERQDATQRNRRKETRDWKREFGVG